MRVVAFAVVLLALSASLAARAGDDAERKIDAAHVKVGQRYRFKLTAQNQSVWEITAKTEDEVTYKIHMTVAGKDLPASEPQHFKLKREKPTRVAKKSGDETLEVSGTKFPCAVYETETGGVVVKTWQSNLFPEGIKTQMGKDVTQELVEIK